MLKSSEPEADNFYCKREISESHDAYSIMDTLLSFWIDSWPC